jgi:hypothetical protein
MPVAGWAPLKICCKRASSSAEAVRSPPTASIRRCKLEFACSRISSREAWSSVTCVPARVSSPNPLPRRFCRSSSPVAAALSTLSQWLRFRSSAALRCGRRALLARCLGLLLRCAAGGPHRGSYARGEALRGDVSAGHGEGGGQYRSRTGRSPRPMSKSHARSEKISRQRPQ